MALRTTYWIIANITSRTSKERRGETLKITFPVMATSVGQAVSATEARGRMLGCVNLDLVIVAGTGEMPTTGLHDRASRKGQFEFLGEAIYDFLKADTHNPDED
jgi:hypothetical protein